MGPELRFLSLVSFFFLFLFMSECGPASRLGRHLESMQQISRVGLENIRLHKYKSCEYTYLDNVLNKYWYGCKLTAQLQSFWTSSRINFLCD